MHRQKATADDVLFSERIFSESGRRRASFLKRSMPSSRAVEQRDFRGSRLYRRNLTAMPDPRLGILQV